MPEPTVLQAAPGATNTGPKPVMMDDIYKLIGALYLEIEVLRRQTTYLREQLAARGGADPEPPA